MQWFKFLALLLHEYQYDLGDKRNEPRSVVPYKMRKFSQPLQQDITNFVLQKGIK